MAKDKIFALIQVHNGRIAELESEMQAELHEDKRKEISERIERLNVELGEKMLEIYNKYKKEL